MWRAAGSVTREDASFIYQEFHVLNFFYLKLGDPGNLEAAAAGEVMAGSGLRVKGKVMTSADFRAWRLGSILESENKSKK